MKILHVCYSDKQGGAAIGAYNLHNSMINEGIYSKYLAVSKVSNDNTVISFQDILSSKIFIYRKFVRKIERKIFLMQKDTLCEYRSLNIFPTFITKFINKSEFDIVQLHWINRNSISIGEIPKIKKKVVWKLPDMWPYSGSEHYSFNFQKDTDLIRFKSGYNKQNRPEHQKGLDLDKLVWKYKKYCWRDTSFSIVATTNWAAEQARTSILFKNKSIFKIANPIDLSLFFPDDKNHSRKLLGLPIEKKIILFGAFGVTTDARKGYLEFSQTIEKLLVHSNSSELAFVFFGTKLPDNVKQRIQEKEVDVYLVGHVEQSDKLRQVYSSSDVFVTTALVESFGLTAAESLACGTPVACFDTSGLRDIVDHQINGYKAKCFCTVDLAKGIKWILSMNNGVMRIKAREAAKKKFSPQKQVGQYLNLYKQLCSSD